MAIRTRRPPALHKERAVNLVSRRTVTIHIHFKTFSDALQTLSLQLFELMVPLPLPDPDPSLPRKNKYSTGPSLLNQSDQIGGRLSTGICVIYDEILPWLTSVIS